MFAHELQRAVEAAPRSRLVELSAALWKAHHAGAIGDDDAQRLAELIAARKVIPAPAPLAPRRVGSRPRSPAAMERRRRWTSSGWMPPQLAARFTMAEAAALAVVASEVAKHGRCDLALDHLATLAGVSRSTVRAAMAEARRLGVVAVELRPRRAFRSDTNVVTILDGAWRSWVSMRRSAPGRGVGAKPRAPLSTDFQSGKGMEIRAGRGSEADAASRSCGGRWRVGRAEGYRNPSHVAKRRQAAP